MKIINMAGPWITSVEQDIVTEMMMTGWNDYRYVEKFEKDFAAWHERKFALMTPCCTHAIHLILLSLGISDGDEVIVPECTWTGSVAPVTYCRATPVFADIDEINWCISPSSVESLITKKTKAIIVVDLYGNMPDMDHLMSISEKYNIPLIEDAAEALGSTLKGVRAGKFGVAGVHSFHRTKTMTTGEGGALLIDDEELYERAKFLRDHGRSSNNPYFILEPTPKYMPSNLQGALACGQFQRIEELVNKKRHFLNQYKKFLHDVPDIQFNTDTDTLYNGAWATSIVFGQKYSINSLSLIEELAKLGIPARPFFFPLSSLPAYEAYGTKSRQNNPVSYDVSRRAITLASHYSLTDKQLEQICKGIKKNLNKN